MQRDIPPTGELRALEFSGGRLRRSVLGAGKLLGSERVPHATSHLPAQQLSPFPWNFAGEVALEKGLVSRENAESIHIPVVLAL